jgi:SagB-type dehydrogenase family enzyme
VSLQALSTILGLTYAVQQWVDIDGERVPLRTSPSGGARHSIEAYVLVLDVDGLAPGTYHYCPDTHALLLVDAATSRESVAELFPAGSGFDRAAALVFATSVFARVQRKYHSPRAYRVVMLEAGHFCQTFCLVTTALGLAPFCTAAFVDDAVENMLGVDGISEAAIYAMGVGSRPEGAVWAPWPDGAEPPDASPPAFAARFSSADPAPPES